MRERERDKNVSLLMLRDWCGCIALRNFENFDKTKIVISMQTCSNCLCFITLVESQHFMKDFVSQNRRQQDKCETTAKKCIENHIELR